MSRQVRTISLPADVAEHLKDNNLNFSKFIAQAYRSSFMQKTALIKERDSLKRKYEAITKEIELLERYESQKKKEKPLPADEVEFFEKAAKVIDKDPGFLDGQLKRYNNTYEAIDRIEFLRRLEKVRGV